MAPLELLILKVLAAAPNPGFGITLHIQTVSGGPLSVEEGSLYPARHRLEKDGLLASEWSTTRASREARFYRLTPIGRKRLAKTREQWAETANGVNRIMRFRRSRQLSRAPRCSVAWKPKRMGASQFLSRGP